MRPTRYAPRNGGPDLILRAIGDATLPLSTLHTRLVDSGHRLKASVLYAGLSRLTASGLLARSVTARGNVYRLTSLGRLRLDAQGSDLPYLTAKLLVQLPGEAIHLETWRTAQEPLRTWARTQVIHCASQLVERELAMRPRTGYLQLTHAGHQQCEIARAIVAYAEFNDIPEDEPR